MSSSESEDFESADEDFGSTKASNKFDKTHIGQTKAGNQSEEIYKLENVSEQGGNNNATSSNKELSNFDSKLSEERPKKDIVCDKSGNSNDSDENFETQIASVENIKSDISFEESCRPAVKDKVPETATKNKVESPRKDENVNIGSVDSKTNTYEPIKSTNHEDIRKLPYTKCVPPQVNKPPKPGIESPISKNCKNKEIIVSDVDLCKKGKDQQISSDALKGKDLPLDNNNKADNDSEGWDFDDWGGSDREEETIENKPKQEQETDEWSDFDDWGDDDSPKRQLSQTDTETKYEKEQQNASNFKTFPVLNELSPNRNRSIQETSKEEQQTDSNFSWGWKPWGGVVSLISSATEGVSSLTSHVSQVIENSIGVPSPEEMIKIQKNKDEKGRNVPTNAAGSNETRIVETQKEDKLLQSFGTIVSGVTNIGSKVLSGGLDTLEGIGKKTMTILQENDPLLLNKRKMLGLDQEKPVLSQILREAKEKSEQTEKNLKQMKKHAYKKQLHFETLFDHYHGLVHLEALEMLSRQSSIKLQSLLDPLTGNALAELQETLDEVKELCELGDFDTEDTDGMYSVSVLSQGFADAIVDLGVKVDFKGLLGCWQQSTEWIESNENFEAQDIYDKALRCLAETSANAVHIMHKLAEMLLIKDHHSTANEADSLVQLTTAFCSHLYGVANRFGSMLNKFDSSEEISSLITSIFLEQTNSITYIQSAFQLFIPILQIGAA